ncbi:hypothetical protein RDABS01_011867 [Bienertia sinuspersici]
MPNCVHCGKYLDTLTVLDKHYDDTHKAFKHKCTTCGNKFRWPKDLSDHKDKSHGSTSGTSGGSTTKG